MFAYISLYLSFHILVAIISSTSNASHDFKVCFNTANVILYVQSIDKDFDE